MCQTTSASIGTAGFDLRQIVMPLVVILCITPSQVLILAPLSCAYIIRLFKLPMLPRQPSEIDWWKENF